MTKNKAAAHVVALLSALDNVGVNDLFLETSRFKNPARNVLRVFKASGPTQAVRDDAGGKRRPVPEGWLQDGANSLKPVMVNMWLANLDSEAAEMAIKLRRLTGTVVSRRGIYAKAPPEAISEFLNSR